MRNVVLLLAGVLAGTACGGDGDDGPAGNDGIASVSLNTPSLTMIQGDTGRLVATAKDAGGNTIASPPATTWRSSNTAVASVNASGLVTAAAPGNAEISAAIGTRSAKATVAVIALPTAVTVDMPGNFFTPDSAVVAIGGIVNFKFQATHNVIFQRINGAPADIGNTQNQTVARQFNTRGKFDYACTLHLPDMTAKVTVR